MTRGPILHDVVDPELPEPSFPAFDLDAHPAPSAVMRGAREHLYRIYREAEEVMRATESGPSVRAFVLAGCRLANLERLELGCGRAENALHHTLSVVMSIALDAARPMVARHEAADGARWCAEELAIFYDQHGLFRHAESVRRAVVWCASSMADRSLPS